MKFGFMVPRESDFGDGGDPYPRIYDLCQRAEELGFDFGTFTHHRFSPERPFLSDPFVLMAAVAARTSRLRLATTVLVLPLYHPLDVAETVASLDHVSGGRVILGVGAGYRPYEAEAVEVPYHRRVSRMTEAVAVLREAWTTDTASFAGEHFNFSDVAVLPKPVQVPHPPIWMGALAPRSIERAGLIGDGWIAPFLQTLEALGPEAARYREAAAASGRPAVICLERDAAVSVDGGQARDAWLSRNLALWQYYAGHGASGLDDPDATAGRTGFDAFAPGRAVAGTPEDCIEQLVVCRDSLGCEYVQLMNLGTGPSFGHPGSYESQRRALELFGREVLPAFAR
ncbi:MAG TPA: LLM class flavin-dependent oxidoreductase [Acidimicrobiales bacterium]